MLSLGHEKQGISRNLKGQTPLMIAAQAGDDESDEVVAGRIAVGKLLISKCPECLDIRDKAGLDAVSTHPTAAIACTWWILKIMAR